MGSTTAEACAPVAWPRGWQAGAGASGGLTTSGMLLACALSAQARAGAAALEASGRRPLNGPGATGAWPRADAAAGAMSRAETDAVAALRPSPGTGAACAADHASCASAGAGAGAGATAAAAPWASAGGRKSRPKRGWLAPKMVTPTGAPASSASPDSAPATTAAAAAAAASAVALPAPERRALTAGGSWGGGGGGPWGSAQFRQLMHLWQHDIHDGSMSGWGAGGTCGCSRPTAECSRPTAECSRPANKQVPGRLSDTQASEAQGLRVRVVWNTHLQVEVHCTPIFQHSQYFFRHLLLLHLQPVRCCSVPSEPSPTCTGPGEAAACV